MTSKRPLVVYLTALSLVIALSIQTASAQGLRGRLRDRVNNAGGSSTPVETTQNQNSSPQVSVVTLQTRPGPGGSQMVVTPKGLVLPLPGAGVNGSTVQIYIGAQGGYWYVDKNNETVDLTSIISAMQSAQQTENVPQYAPQPEVTNNYNQAPQAATGAAAAGIGAMAGSMLGAAMTNSYYNNVPYGTPIHYPVGGYPYYHRGGKPVYINNSTKTANVTQVNNQIYNQHATNLQQQQAWYQKQKTTNSAQWKNWQQKRGTANPFLSSANGRTPTAAAGGRTAAANRAAGASRAAAGGNRAAGASRAAAGGRAGGSRGGGRGRH